MKKIYITLLCISLFAIAKSQQVSTLYFLDNAPMRHYLNPSFQPLSNVYISLPVIGYTDLGVGNNSLSMKNVLHTNKAGETVSFLHPDGKRNSFLNAIKPTLNTNYSTRINLLSAGWRWNEGYWHIDMNLRANGLAGLPRDIFNFALDGMMGKTADDLLTPTTVNMKKLGVDVNNYAEFGLGYSRIINDKVTVGGKVKYLYGLGNASLRNSALSLNATNDEWVLSGAGSAYMTGNFIDYPSSISNIADTDIKDGLDIYDYIKPAGGGLAFDLGVTYNPIEMLTLSLAVTDLGFISWKGKKYDYGVEAKYDGIGELNYNDLSSDALGDTILNRLEGDLENMLTDNGTKDRYSLMVSPRINVGAEVNFWDDRLGLGVHSMTQFVASKVQQEITLGANLRPVNWFNLATSYSFFNGRFSSIGAGIGLRGGPIHLTVAADYIPFTYAEVPAGSMNIPAPYKVKGINVGVGLSIVIGNRQDKDRDGVKDKFDLCPNTPIEAEVDENGCPLDTDGDGVPDYMDNCPNTLPEAISFVDSLGCDKDTDGDGVPDYLDRCADTPKDAYGLIDEYGCPLDTDGDSVPDYIDQCPTPAQAIGLVDSVGCPLDTDIDGVPDYLDRCPNTPQEALGQIDEHGCPIDTDNDGVPNYFDKCPNTLPEAAKFVDEWGCDKDTDGDGVPDYKDDCIRTPGTAANNGCPEVKSEVRKLFTKALQGISFATGKAVITYSSYSILNQIATVLNENPTYKVEIQGHTDDVGKDELNKTLSEKRANAVRSYLLKKGVDEDRMTAVGYGEEKPVATNKTAAGRYKNRRVEFVVSFEEIVLE